MTIARRGWKVKVIGQANAIGPTSIEGSFSSWRTRSDDAIASLLSSSVASDLATGAVAALS